MNCWHSLPAEVYALVEQTPATVLLECSKPSDSESRLFIAPKRVVAAREAAELPGLFDEIESAAAAGHFAAGFFTYECGSGFEPKGAQLPAAGGQPLAWFGIFEQCFRFDHREGAFLNGAPLGLAAPRSTRLPDESTAPEIADLSLALTETEYSERIAAIHEWIRAGDVYQLNFTVPLSVRVKTGPAALYRHLRTRQPVEYGAFLHWRDRRHILSFSPELFFRIEPQGESRSIATKPMK